MTSIGSLGTQIGTGTTNSLAVTTAAPAGAVVVICGAINTNTTVSSVSDSRGNSWSSYITASSGSPVVKCYMAWSVLTTALAVSDDITVTLATATSKHAMAAAAWSGLTGSPVDKSSIGNAGSSSSPSPGASGVLAQADEVLVCAIATNQLTADTISLSGWTLTEQEATNSGSNDRRISLYEKTVLATTSVTPTASLSSSTTWGAVLLTLKLDTTPPPAGAVKAWDGSAWVTGVPKAWDGSAWVTGIPKVWDGSSWTTP